MSTSLKTAIAASAVLGCACDTRDVVEPGDYGGMQAGARAATSASDMPRTMAQSSTPSMRTQMTMTKPMSSTAPGSAGSAAKPSAAGQMAASTAGSMSTSMSSDKCDMTGRWLMTRHFVVDGLGQYQYTHSWSYYEIARKDADFTVTRGLECGEAVTAGSDFAANADFKPSWRSVMMKNPAAGRGVTSVPAAMGCNITLAKIYIIKGATVPYYLDPTRPLPTAEQKATDTTPGWEDWDEDGHPGVTAVISGAVSGKIFVAARGWNQLMGTVPDTSAVMKLTLDWNQEPGLLGIDGSPLLTGEAVRASDANLHFAQLARLMPDQAANQDDDTTCQTVRELAPMLTPEASAL